MMILAPSLYRKKTEKLAQALKPSEVYAWLVTKGYFPESYVVPPCFVVTKHPNYGKLFFPYVKKFKPTVTEYQQVHFPKTGFTDRTYGIVHPEIHSDIALTFAKHWKSVLKILFDKQNKVCSYSFPVPLDAKNPGKIGSLRSGRMIYEWIEMAESDVAAIAYNYRYLIKTDIKNFYPSIYTHSIPWALHGKRKIRSSSNRNDYNFFGNRLDKLFQNANDGCTNGIPIGPAISDLASEVILAAVDKILSKSIDVDCAVVRFKDDYRILTNSEEQGRSLVKCLQAALKEYRLELNDDKTEFFKLPNGIFREWVSEYLAVNPFPKKYYDFGRFKEIYLAVLKIDERHSGCGVIDRFLADIVTRNYKLRIRLDKRSMIKVISLLLLLAERRTKAFPKVLGIIESILRSKIGKDHSQSIAAHLDAYLNHLSKNEKENRYLISWICYFVRANNLESHLTQKPKFKDPIVKATYTSRTKIFKQCIDFNLYTGVKTISKSTSMLQHLDVFKPQ